MGKSLQLSQGEGKTVLTGGKVPLSIGYVYLRGELSWRRGPPGSHPSWWKSGPEPEHPVALLLDLEGQDEEKSLPS